MNNKTISIFILIIIFISGCNKGKLEGSSYIKYVENKDNGLNNEKKIGNLDFQLQYCPTEYLLLKELKTEMLPGKLLDEKRKQNDSMIFFKLRIKTNNDTDILNYHIQSNDEAYERIGYLSYGFEEDIALVNNTDTIFPATFHFERVYGVAPFADFMFSFNTSVKKGDDLQVIIDDKVFNSGLLKFNYDTKDIQNIPTIKTN